MISKESLPLAGAKQRKRTRFQSRQPGLPPLSNAPSSIIKVKTHLREKANQSSRKRARPALGNVELSLQGSCGGSVASRDRLARKDFLTKDLLLTRAIDNREQSNFWQQVGRKVHVLESVGYTQGWLLIDPELSGDWYPAWVIFDPGVPMLFIQPGHRHRISDGPLYSFELDYLHSHIVMTNNAFHSAHALQGIYTFRIDIRDDTPLYFAATLSKVAQVWVTTIRDALARRLTAPPQVEFESGDWQARQNTPLKSVCGEYYYEHFEFPSNGKMALRDTHLKKELQLCGLGITMDTNLSQWFVVSRSSQDYAAPRIQSLVRGFLARRRVQRIRQRKLQQRQYRQYLRNKKPHDDFPQVRKVTILAPRLGNKACTWLQALFRAFKVRVPFLMFRKAVSALQRRWRAWLARRNHAVITIQCFLRICIAKTYRSTLKYFHQRVVRQQAQTLWTQGIIPAIVQRDHASRSIQTWYTHILDHRKATRLKAIYCAQLQYELIKCQERAATRIQAMCRRYIVYHQYHKELALYYRVRDIIRGYLARRGFTRKRWASTKVTASFRGKYRYNAYQTQRKAILVIQTTIRMWIHARTWQHKQRLLVLIQKSIRGWLVRRMIRKWHTAAVKAQAFIRAFVIARPTYRRQRRAAVILSCNTRKHIARMRLHREIAARALQAQWRGLRHRRVFRALFNIIRLGVIAFQAQVRGVRVRLKRCNEVKNRLDRLKLNPYSSRPAELSPSLIATLHSLGRACGILQTQKDISCSSVSKSHRNCLFAIFNEIKEPKHWNAALQSLHWLADAVQHLQWRMPRHGPRLLVSTAAFQLLASIYDSSTYILRDDLYDFMLKLRTHIRKVLFLYPEVHSTQFESLGRITTLTSRIRNVEANLHRLYEAHSMSLQYLQDNYDQALQLAHRHGEQLVDDIDRAQRKIDQLQEDVKPTLGVLADARKFYRRLLQRQMPCNVDKARLELAQAQLAYHEQNVRISGLPLVTAKQLQELSKLCQTRLETRVSEAHCLHMTLHNAAAWIPYVLEMIVTEVMGAQQGLGERAKRLEDLLVQLNASQQVYDDVRNVGCWKCHEHLHESRIFGILSHELLCKVENAYIELSSGVLWMASLDFAEDMLRSIDSHIQNLSELINMWYQETSSLLASQGLDRQLVLQDHTKLVAKAQEEAQYCKSICEKAQSVVREIELDPTQYWWSSALRKWVMPEFVFQARCDFRQKLRESSASASKRHHRNPKSIKRQGTSMIPQDQVDDDEEDEEYTGADDSSTGINDGSSDDSLSTCSCSSCELLREEREEIAREEMFDEIFAQRQAQSLRRKQEQDEQIIKALRQRRATERIAGSGIMQSVRSTIFRKAEESRRHERAVLIIQTAWRMWRAQGMKEKLAQEMRYNARIYYAASVIQSLYRRVFPLYEHLHRAVQDRYLKVRFAGLDADSSLELYFYVDRLTGERSWTRPLIMERFVLDVDTIEKNLDEVWEPPSLEFL